MVSTDSAEHNFSLIKGDLLYNVQKAVGLIKDDKLCTKRRAAFFVIFTWVPLAIWAVITNNAFFNAEGEPLLQHFSMNARFLLALPILILSEQIAERHLSLILSKFLSSGILAGEEKEKFHAVLDRTTKTKASIIPWLFVAAVIVISIIIRIKSNASEHELGWALQHDHGVVQTGLAFWWFVLVSGPIFATFLSAWVLRLILVITLFQRISHLKLDLVATHPDRVGGLSFVKTLPQIFTGFVFSVSAVISARFAHEVYYHNVSINDLKLPLICLVVVLSLISVAPLFLFIKELSALKRKSLFDYGCLVAKQGRLVRQKWIENNSVQGDILNAPEIGPVADAVSMYNAVTDMRGAPFDRDNLILVFLPIVIPILPVIAFKCRLRM